MEHEMNADVKTSEYEAWEWARLQQGFIGTFADWQKLSPRDRQQYELGAAGLPTDIDH